MITIKSTLSQFKHCKCKQFIKKKRIKIIFSYFVQIDKDTKLQAGALFAIGNLLHQSSRHAKLKEIGILTNLEKLLNMTPRESQFYEE
jgi:hypothetical protein